VNLLASPGWVEIVLDRPFNYDGTSNLVVAVDENTDLYDAYDCRFLEYGGATNRGLFFYSDITNPNPASPPAAMAQESIIPNIIFQMDPVLYPPCGESFDLPAVPPAWAQYRSANIGMDLWSTSPTNYAGGNSPELQSIWVSVIGTSRLISPPVQTAGLSSLELEFKHYFDDYGTGVTGKLQYSHDMNTWLDSGWSFDSGAGDISGTVTLPLSGLVGNVTYLAWVLEGDLYYFDRWYLDDVSVNIPLIDVAPLRIDTPEVVDFDTFTPQATFINNGSTTADFAVTFTLGDAAYVNTQTVTGLAPGATQTVDFANALGWVNFTMPMRATTHLVNDQVSANDQIGKDLTSLILDKQVYADIYDYNYPPTRKGPSTFYLKTPGTLTHLGAPSVTNVFMAGGEWIGNAWFGTEYDTDSLAYDNYYRIDHHTGVQTLLGQTGVPIHGLAWDSNHNILYGTNLTSLYMLNQATGAATLLGPHVNTPLMIGLAYDSYTDTLYGVDLSTDALYSIDTSTGLATQVGLLGIDINLGQDLAFDREHGYLFLAGYNMGSDPGPHLYWIDQSTGLAHKIGDFPEDTQVVGFAIPSEPLVLNLRIAANGVLSWDPVPGVTEYRIYGANYPYATTYTHLANTSSTSWLDPIFPQPMRFYYVSAAYTRSDAEPVVVRYLTEYKDPLTGELLDPQPVVEPAAAQPLPAVNSGENSAGLARP